MTRPSNVPSNTVSRGVLMRAYDRMPRAIRQEVANAAFNYDTREVEKFWRALERDGLSPVEAAAVVRRMATNDATKLAVFK